MRGNGLIGMGGGSREMEKNRWARYERRSEGRPPRLGLLFDGDR